MLLKGEKSLSSKTKGMLNKQLGIVLRSRRMKLGKEIAEIAHHADISYTYLSKIENGYKNPSYEVISKISLALGTVPSSISLEVEQRCFVEFKKLHEKNVGK